VQSAVQPFYKSSAGGIAPMVRKAINAVKAPSTKENLYQGPRNTGKMYRELYDLKVASEGGIAIKEFKTPELDVIGDPDLVYVRPDETIQGVE